jgi:hypothetical protein
MAAWFEDEEVWAATYPIIFPEERFEVAEEEVERILKLVGFRPAAVLDLACGPRLWTRTPCGGPRPARHQGHGR